MEKFYSNDNDFLAEGPSDLSIKRILAFSKAMENTSKSVIEKEEEQA